MAPTRFLSAKELAGVLTVLAIAAVYALLNPEMLGAAPQAKGLTVAIVHANPYKKLAARCARESFPAACTARLVRESLRASAAPLRAGEQMRSTPPARPLGAPERADFCAGGSCPTRPNEPTEAWERGPVPAIDSVATE